ncbi:helix-turn-helix transcriptional regulator [Streptomyces sp. NPDC091272]|uniref:helix-turn-helix transcriptional regulator n=1 Tax=Streptomyces sp. NPDC091272 TaxID=3365981 RepID=UPI0037F49B3A
MEDINAIAALQDSVRRALYEYVAARGREVGRNEAAEAVGVTRTLAAHHLDKLTEVGLLESGSRRLTGRSGPGAGRPAKVYTLARAERSVSLPARDYRTLAELLAEAAEQAGLDTRLFAAARHRGEAERGAQAPPEGLEEVMEMLAARGYAPHLENVADGGGGADRAHAAGPADPAGPVDPTRPVDPARPARPTDPARSEAPDGRAGAGVAGDAAGTDGAEGADGVGRIAPRVVRMRNCPFHVVAERFPPLVCGMNFALLQGLLGSGPVTARMDARPGECCVVLEDSKNNTD